jgi:hypothetical protein
MLKPIRILFLPGTDLSDLFYAPLLSTLKTYGSVHQWKYRHHESMMAACKRHNGSAELFEELRHEVCFGRSHAGPSLLGLQATDSICHYYENTMGDRPPLDLWKQTIVVGHSQGAGHALLLSQQRKLAGAIMIAGPADAYKGELSPWTQKVFQTPSSRRLMLIHIKDAGNQAAQAHAKASGLQIQRQDTDSLQQVGAMAIVETEAVTAFSAHGCLAGEQTWGHKSPWKSKYNQLLKSHIETWRDS